MYCGPSDVHGVAYACSHVQACSEGTTLVTMDPIVEGGPLEWARTLVPLGAVPLEGILLEASDHCCAGLSPTLQLQHLLILVQEFQIPAVFSCSACPTMLGSFPNAKTRLHNAMTINTTNVNANCCQPLSTVSFKPKSLNVMATCGMLLLDLLFANLPILRICAFSDSCVICSMHSASPMLSCCLLSSSNLVAPKRNSKNRFRAADNFFVFRSLTFNLAPIGATSNNCLRIALCS